MTLAQGLLAWCAGVGLVQTLAALPPFSVLMQAALLLAVAAWLLPGTSCVRRHARTRAARVVLLPLLLLAGVGYATLRAEARLANALADAWQDEDVRLVGVVDELPRLSPAGVRFAFRVEAVDPAHARIPSRVSLAWYAGATASIRSEGQALPRVRAGERWQLPVRLRRPHGTFNPGAFDLEAWLLQRNLRATGYVRSHEPAQRIDASTGRFLDRVQQLREAVRDRILAHGMAPRLAGILVALSIGDQSNIDDDTWRVLNRTGIGHLVSISGLHVTVFALMAGAIALSVVRRFSWLTSRVPARKLALAIGVAASWGYVLIAGAEIPAQRTLVMLAVAAVAAWAGRLADALLVWTWALAIVLFIDPWAVLAAGFWLSFVAVGLLLYASASTRVSAAVPGRLGRLRETLLDAARGQAAITVGLTPLSLALFGQVSLIGPLANAVAIPWVTYAIVPVALAGVFLPWDLGWGVAALLLAPLVDLMDRFSALPAAAWSQHAPPPWTVMTAGLGVALLLGPRAWPGRWIGVLALLPMACIRPALPPAGSAWLSVLDVGQGTAVIVQTQNHVLVYDTGPNFGGSADAGGRILVPVMRARGLRSVDTLVISHRDLDHAGGALSLLDVVPVHLLLASLEAGHPIAERVALQGMAMRCHAGQQWSWDGVRFEMLFPRATHYTQAHRKSNDLSCVLRITSARGARALLAGDIEADSELDLLVEAAAQLPAELLLVPHHGSRTSSTVSFVERVAPRHAVFSMGHRNRFGHPRADVVDRYRAIGAELHRTDHGGALDFVLDAPVIAAPTRARDQHLRYWHDRTEGPARREASR